MCAEKTEIAVDTSNKQFYSYFMRWLSMIVILAIALCVTAPPAMSVALSQQGRPEIGVLDVCHSAATALSSNGDMPCMDESPCRPLPLARNEIYAAANSPMKPVLMVFQDERPPKV